MGLFDFMKKRDDEPTAPAPVRQEHVMQCNDVLLQALLNGETITREKVLMLPIVNSAVDFISNTIASMPVKLYKQKQGKVEEITDDNRTRYLNSDTGDTLDGFQLKKAMVSDYLLGKGGYCYIRRERNEATGLFYVSDQNITVMLYSNDAIHKDYQLLVNAQSYEQFDFIKLLRNTKDGASGVGLTVEVNADTTAYIENGEVVTEHIHRMSCEQAAYIFKKHSVDPFELLNTLETLQKYNNPADKYCALAKMPILLRAIEEGKK